MDARPLITATSGTEARRGVHAIAEARAGGLIGPVIASAGAATEAAVLVANIGCASVE